MAEVLSLAASIIAVLGAAESVVKGLLIIHSVLNASDEILALNNEISDLQILLYDVQRHVERASESQIPHEHAEQLDISVNQAKEKLLQLDELMQYKILTPHASAKKVKISRREWLKAVKVIERSQQSLRDIRSNIVARFLLINT